MKRGNLVIILTSLLVMSCGQQQKRLKVTYLSDPPGGTLYKQNGEVWGRCPKVLWYGLSDDALAAGKLQAKGLVVRWPDGSEKRSDEIITFQIDRTDQRFTFVQSNETPSNKGKSDNTISETTNIDRAKVVADAGLIEEPDKDTIQIVKKTVSGNQSEGIIEKQVGTEQAKAVVVEPGILEETEWAQTEKVETSKAIDPNKTTESERPQNEKVETSKAVKTVDSDESIKAEKTEPNRIKVESVANATEHPNKEIVENTVEIKTIDLGDSVQMEFVRIPAGEFQRKNDSDEIRDDPNNNLTQRVIITKPFYMGKYEVTQKQYETIMGTNPSSFNGYNLPVEKVSWYDAEVFCKKLSAKKNLTFRLPTEAEWEYACRAGTTTTYYWGDDFDSRYAHTIIDRDSNQGTVDVGTLEPNKWGLFDMSGNVWEWCSDLWAEYNSHLTLLTDPKGPSGEEHFHILRGGSWGNSPRSCGSAYRNWNTPNHRYDDCGFRVVMEAGPPSK